MTSTNLPRYEGVKGIRISAMGIYAIMSSSTLEGKNWQGDIGYITCCVLITQHVMYQMPMGEEDALSDARHMVCAVGNGLVQVHITVADLDVESAMGIAAYPSFVMNRSSLSPKV